MAADVEHRIPTLKSIELENIGPFHSTHIEFTPQWNVLLGDNGVGKTIVLKAIAAALCGDRADTRAISKLLRVGAEKGSIRLRDEEREYSIELERELDGTVRIVSPNISPIIYHRWLVLGFPALRGVPSNSPAGPTNAKKQAPSPED